MPDPLARFDGAAVWETLDAEQQAAVGAAALELAAALAMDDHVEAAHEPDCRLRRVYFAFGAGDATGLLEEAVKAAVDPGTIRGQADLPRVPSGFGQICRDCGCSQGDACVPPCSWVGPDLCSACADDGFNRHGCGPLPVEPRDA